jgi:hypothetical protein
LWLSEIGWHFKSFIFQLQKKCFIWLRNKLLICKSNLAIQQSNPSQTQNIFLVQRRQTATWLFNSYNPSNIGKILLCYACHPDSHSIAP